MTRMLCSIIAIFLCGSMMGGCSLFSSDEEVTQVDEVDSSSLGGDELGATLDAEDELLEESDDLVENNEVATEAFPEESLDPEAQENLDEEFGLAELNPEEDTTPQFSETNENEIDQNLAGDEFNDFNDADFEEGGEEMALGDEPVVDVPTDPVVDLPQDEMAITTSANEVTNLEYKAFENGGTVVIETALPANYQTIENKDLNQLIIQVDGAKLPQRFKRPYVTKDFKQDIATINAYEDKATGSARFVIQLKRPIKPLVQKEGTSILVMTGDSSPVIAENSEPSLDQLVEQNQMEISSSAEGSGASNSQISMNNQTLSTGKGIESGSGFGAADKSGIALNSGKFTGRPINLEYVDTDVRTIIETIADQSGVNLIMDKEVKGKTSIRLRGLPWDQALVVILRSEGLGYVKQGNVLRIAKQSKLSQEAQAVSQQIKSEKEAKLLSSGLKVKYIPVSYANVSELAKKLEAFVSKDGKIAFDNRTSSLVITDYGEYIERVIELTRALDTPPMQVEIAAKLVEAREEFTQQAGINWELSGGTFGSGNTQGSLGAALGGALNTDGLTMDLNVGTFDVFGDLTAALALFEQEDKIKVLSQPRTVTMNKSKATIEQVTQIPIETITPAVGGVVIPQITYQDLNLSLDVTPQITFKGDVILDVELKREFPGTLAANGNVEINKRRSKTTVMVKNGKTAVIGGIYQLDERDTDTGIPWLKDIPLIGSLFRQSTEVKSKNELLLFIKPKIIKEIEEPEAIKVSSPGKNYDPFEELSVDEGSEGPVVDTPADEGGDELDDESFDEEDFGDEEALTL